MRIKKFDRYELKYVLTTAQQRQMVKVLSEFLSPDKMGDELGGYVVTSLYFDSEDYKAYWDKIEGHKFRRKVRIRVYGTDPVTPQTPCFTEIKQRINKTVQKKRGYLPYEDAFALCSTGSSDFKFEAEDRGVIEEIQYLHYTQQLQPACIVTYHRAAFQGSEYDPGLRITFDTSLKGRTHELSLTAKGLAKNQYFIPPEWCIMEVKVNYRVPYWLTELIGKHRCTLRRVSKYCAALEQSKSLLKTQQITY